MEPKEEVEEGGVEEKRKDKKDKKKKERRKWGRGRRLKGKRVWRKGEGFWGVVVKSLEDNILLEKQLFFFCGHFSWGK